MAKPKPRRRQKVALRKSHAVYQWKVLSKICLVVAIWSGLILSGVFATRAGYEFWRESTWFRIKNVQVDPKAPAGLAQSLGLKAGGHLFGFSAPVLEARLANSYPELSEVNVRRWWDGGVRVSVARRIPRVRVPDGAATARGSAGLSDGAQWMGMDDKGTLFPLRSSEVAPETLPVLAGVAGPQAIPVMKFIASLKSQNLGWTKRLMKIKADEDGDIFLFLDNGTPVYWGEVPSSEKILRKKSARLERVLKDDSLAGGAAYVRFVDDARIAVKPMPAEADQGNGRK